MKLKRTRSTFDPVANERQRRTREAANMLDQFMISGENTMTVVPELGDNITSMELAQLLDELIQSTNKTDDRFAGIRVAYLDLEDEAILYRIPEL